MKDVTEFPRSAAAPPERSLSVDMGAGSRSQTYRGQFKVKLRLVSSNPPHEQD